MRVNFLLLLVLVTGQVSAQVKPLPGVFIFVAGVAEGVQDGLQFHYSKNDQFWNPSLSWRNKYKNRDALQGKTFVGKYFVTFTDGWHLMKTTNHFFIMGAIVTGVGEKRKWYKYIFDGLAYWLINRIAFNLSYNLF